jgi:hypothetical protein
MRGIVSTTLFVLIPLYMTAGPPGTAMLYAHGTVWVNGSAVPGNIAVLPGDVMQTGRGAAACVNASRSQVTVVANSLAMYGINKISLDYGDLTVATFSGTTALVGEVAIVPLLNTWTVFQVSAGGGKAEISALQGSVSVTHGSETTTLSPGQHKTVHHSHQRRGATPAGQGPALDSTPVVITGAAAIVVLEAWVLMRDSNAISKVQP